MGADLETKIEAKDSEETLREELHKISKERGYKNYKLDIMTSSSVGANFGSIVYTATISEHGKDDINIFAKIAFLSEKARSDAPFQAFDVEILFYTDIIKIYKQIEEKHKVPIEHRLVVPELYGVSSKYLKETIVMENLMSKGYQMFDRFKTIDWNYTKESLTQLAKLHSLSIAFYIDHPKSFSEKTEKLRMKIDRTHMEESVRMMMMQILESAKDEHKERLKQFIENLMASDDYMMKPIKRMVLSHGDYRPNNLLHKLNEDGTYDIIPIDYQTMTHSNPIVDLLYFLFNGSDKEFRAKYLRKAFDHYYNELCACLTRLDLNPKQIYPKEDFEFELKEVLPLGLSMSLVLLMVITVEMDHIPKIHEDMELKDLFCTPSEAYKIRMNDLLEDCIDMGVL